MLIVLEGPDGAGKTTLAEKLVEAIRTRGLCQLLHVGPIRSHPVDEYEVPLIGYNPSFSIVLDRWHIGEAVYGPLLRGTSQLDLASRRHIDMVLRRHGGIILHVTAPVDVLQMRLNLRGDDLIKSEQLEWITAAYHDALFDGVLGHAIIDATAPNVERDILTAAINAQLKTLPLVKFTTLIGDPNPRYLLFGDTRKTTELPWAFAPRAGTPGKYLIENLPMDVVSECAIANACDVDDSAEIWSALGQPAVVALGQNAADALAIARIPRGVVPSPQHAQRTHGARGWEYGALIREALMYGGAHDFTH